MQSLNWRRVAVVLSRSFHKFGHVFFPVHAAASSTLLRSC